MSVLSRPAMRWLVPAAAAVVVIGGGAAAGTIVATADQTLPERSAAQLLVDLQNAQVDGLSGTVVETADLGLPGLGGASLGSASDGSLLGLVGGNNTARVWYAGPDKTRLALMGTQGETDVVHNGTDVWYWDSVKKTAEHFTLSAADAAKTPHPGTTALGTTPQEAADAALKAIDPTTAVTTTGAAKVAGRDAYELVLSPKDTASLVGQVRLAIDAEHHIPLRVDVYAKNATSPAVRVAFSQISFGTPDAQQFTFNAPPGTKVTESGAAGKPGSLPGKPEKAGVAERDGMKVIGKGWTSVVTAKLPADVASGTAPTGKSDKSGTTPDPQAMLGMLPKVSGTWGSGHLLSGSLFSVLLTDDGRVYAGLVSPETLYAAAATK